MNSEPLIRPLISFHRKHLMGLAYHFQTRVCHLYLEIHSPLNNEQPTLQSFPLLSQ